MRAFSRLFKFVSGTCLLLLTNCLPDSDMEVAGSPIYKVQCDKPITDPAVTNACYLGAATTGDGTIYRYEFMLAETRARTISGASVDVQLKFDTSNTCTIKRFPNSGDINLISWPLPLTSIEEKDNSDGTRDITIAF